MAEFMDKKANTSLVAADEKGRFVRMDSMFRDTVSDDHPIYKPEPHRYHLYIAYGCPWANRCLVTRNLKGLEEVIGLSVVHPTWQRTRPDDPEDMHTGWVFRSPTDPPLSSPAGKGSFPCDDCIPDPHNHAASVRDLYEIAIKNVGGDGQQKVRERGRYSVPVLWDTKTSTIVNNESAEIVRIFNSAFNSIAKHPELDLYPQEHRATIDEINAWVYDDINNGVYKCGFSQTQEAYDEAVVRLYDALDRVEAMLGNNPNKFIAAGTEHITEADIRLFQTLVRFDEVYEVYFKCNKRRIVDYPHILEYCRRLYQMPEVASSVNMDHIKMHYYTSHPHLNHYAIIPAGPGFLDVLKRKQ